MADNIVLILSEIGTFLFLSLGVLVPLWVVVMIFRSIFRKKK